LIDRKAMQNLQEVIWRKKIEIELYSYLKEIVLKELHTVYAMASLSGVIFNALARSWGS